MHKRDYPWVLSCNIPNVSEIDQSCVNDGAFSHLWQHIVLQNMYVDRSGYRFVKIGTLDKDLVLVLWQQLYTFMAFRQWLETKPHHKHLILQNTIESGKLFGVWSPNIALKFSKDLWYNNN